MSELDVLRGAIDEVDRQIVALFERRMAVTQQVGEYKQAHDIPVLDAHRERQVIANKLDCLQNQDLRTDVTLLYETIMGISRRQQRRRQNAQKAYCSDVQPQGSCTLFPQA